MSIFKVYSVGRKLTTNFYYANINKGIWQPTMSVSVSNGLNMLTKILNRILTELGLSNTTVSINTFNTVIFSWLEHGKAINSCFRR